MFGLVLSDDQVDRIIDRVLTHERVERIAQRVAELLREQGAVERRPRPPADVTNISFDTGFRNRRKA